MLENIERMGGYPSLPEAILNSYHFEIQVSKNRPHHVTKALPMGQGLSTCSHLLRWGKPLTSSKSEPIRSCW